MTKAPPCVLMESMENDTTNDDPRLEAIISELAAETLEGMSLNDALLPFIETVTESVKRRVWHAARLNRERHGPDGQPTAQEINDVLSS